MTNVFTMMLLGVDEDHVIAVLGTFSLQNYHVFLLNGYKVGPYQL